LLSYLVPISLFVSMEIVSLAQGVLFISRDEGMRDPVTKERAIARNTNLNEDLGHIGHVFSDKTGTLTCNDMRLRALLLDGFVIGNQAGVKLEHCGLRPPEAVRAFDYRLADALQHSLHDGNDSADTLRCETALEALTAIAVCHSLIIDGQQDGDELAYTGPSPDEVAIVDGARMLGVIFKSRSSRGVTVNVLGTAVNFDVLATLEFSSERQRMSVIVRRPDGRITLFCKGADAAVLPLLMPREQLSARDADILSRTELGLHSLATTGLRTLLIASRELSPERWASVWSCRDMSAQQRQAHLAAQLECDLKLLGASGVEDQLQEGVHETIRMLLSASIKVWVLTGDKLETALCVGTAAGLLTSPDAVLLLNAGSPTEAGARMQTLRSHSAGAELVVDGATLGHILSNAELAKTFAELGASARAVCVCRCSPRQKSAVVKLMQRHLHSAHAARHSWYYPLVGEPPGRTLAIGDGANDVAMIQAADVGVGIAGREGRQAVNCADFGISQFRFLQRLLFVHGTLCRYRLCRLIKYSFYKNVAFCCLLLFFQLRCGYSGQALYDSISAGLFNVVLTSLPVIVFALFDRPLSDAGLLAHPQVYNRSRSLSGRTFWKTLVDAAVHGSICLFFALYGVPSSGGVRSDAMSGLLQVGKVAYTAILVTVTLELCLHVRYLTALFAAVTLLSLASWWLLLWLVPHIVFVTEFEAMAPLLLPSPVFWLVVALSTGAAMAYRIAWLAVVSILKPGDLELLNEQEVKHAVSPVDMPSSSSQAQECRCSCGRNSAQAHINGDASAV
jgi:magnesium-transporting ATPase (P-type)